MTHASKQARSVKVAAIQVASENGQIEANLRSALPFVEKAAAEGATLVVLPEFLPTGYVLTQAIWDAAEPSCGPTVQWLQKHSERLGIHLGTSFLEAEAEHFFNTFVLTTPEGKEAGRVRKQTPALFEAFFTKGDAGSHIIETELGRIGVGICYENTLAYTPKLMIEHDADLMLMPHSAPLPEVSLFVRPKLRRFFNNHFATLSVRYAKLLGIPTVMVNKTGRWQTPIPFLPFSSQDSVFAGLTSIADSDGRLKAQMQREEGIVVETVLLDPDRKKKELPRSYGRWARRMPVAAGLCPWIEALGEAWYRRSGKRKVAGGSVA